LDVGIGTVLVGISVKTVPAPGANICFAVVSVQVLLHVVDAAERVLAHVKLQGIEDIEWASEGQGVAVASIGLGASGRGTPGPVRARLSDAGARGVRCCTPPTTGTVAASAPRSAALGARPSAISSTPSVLPC
jgi:hypothetical protein